jgi:Protein of unknown function (DUF2000)
MKRRRVLRWRGKDAAFDLAAFPSQLIIQGQQTNDYNEFRQMMRCTAPEAIRYLGVMIFGSRKKVYPYARGHGYGAIVLE